MSTRCQTLAAACVALLALSRPGLAQEAGVAASADLAPGDGRLELGLFFGAFLPSDSHEFYDYMDTAQEPLEGAGPEFGVRLGYFPLRFLGIEGEAELLPFGTESGASALLYGARAHLVAQLPARLTPFILGGIGTMGVSSDANVLSSDADTVGHLGLGLKYQASRWLSLRLDGRLLRAPEAGTDTGTNHFSVLGGVALTLGGGAAEHRPAPPVDGDGDGILEPDDVCPGQPGSPPDGCPSSDTDGDGLLDDVDRCPAEAEAVNGHEDDDGCPDQVPDRDGDGIPDALDACVDQAEDGDGYEDQDGCPELDNDGDGVTDTSDRCPTEIGPAENRGCPDTDRDGDGVVDRQDNCPDEAGTAANHGCKKKQLAVITQTQVKILDTVHFNSNKATIKRRSNRLLDNVAQVIINHPEVQLIRIEGHTDDRGDEAYNKELSQRRAEAVMAYLESKGVPASRMEAVGLGEERPLTSNRTSRGRAANRRVEFNIVDGPGVKAPADAAGGAGAPAPESGAGSGTMPPE